ncbi:MAG: MurR/RpiR family transcriptional regulator [Clostridia bacterium]|nr:MurR/RpiR family transcriptional regulator [Clostridia bacterium]MBR5771962.1 MurR/RpiR family transcriptional regulator [Clostridia bacterium]
MPDRLNEKIEFYYPTMSKGQKKIADFITKNGEKASFMTASALGDAVGVSESTVVRFASDIGYRGYPELRKGLQENIKNKLTSVQRMEAAGKYDGDDFINRAFSADIEMIKQTRDNISRKDFFSAVSALNRARRIYILGVRSSAFLAGFASYYLNFFYDSVLINTSAESEMFEQMLKIKETDVCIAVSFPRYSARTVNALKYAKSRGAKIISVTDSPDSPIAPYADCLLLASSNMVSFVDSLAAPLSLMNALIAAAAMEKKEEFSEELEALEKIWDEYRIYRTNEE